MADLPVHEIFNDTIQGEGYWSGIGASFIRLSGCPVGCRWCDTGYADGGKGLPRESISIDEIVGAVTGRHVVITGGEPFIHSRLGELVKALQDKGHFVQIETSGAFFQPVSAWITLSPKEHVANVKVDPVFWTLANEVKIVVESESDFDFYASRLPEGVPLFVQPCEQEGVSFADAVRPVLAIVGAHPKVRASFQLHKIIGVR